MIVMGKKLEYLVFYLFTIWTSPEVKLSLLLALPCAVSESLSDGHLTGPSEDYPQLVALQDEVQSALGSQVERRGGGGDQHVSTAH